MTEIPEYVYTPPGPVAAKFLNSEAFIRGIRGPIGSGKSTACVMEILARSKDQAPNSQGKRQTRWGVVRNTFPELKTTTIKTWEQWVPLHFGHWRDQGPPTHTITDGDLEMEVMFLALDRPDDVKKLLSMELTGAWINEAREVPKAILDALTGRVGRYPPKRDGGPTWSGIIMDTNSPDPTHWWAKSADFADEEERIKQEELEKQLIEMGALAPGTKLIEFFTQPPAVLQGDKPNPNAENLTNLPTGYYLKAMANKKDDWIKVYIRNEYHYVVDGKTVYDAYRGNLHTRAYSFIPHWPIDIGMDFGLTPAAVFSQRSPMGQVRVHSELVATRLGAKSFAREIKTHLGMRYPNCKIGHIFGDPSGEGGGNDDESVYKLMASEGVIAKPASTNDPSVRIEAVNTLFGLLIDGEPALVINPECIELHKACAGGYHYRRIQISSELRYDEKPNKNMSSHVAEALQYDILGYGIGKQVIARPASITMNRAAFAEGVGIIKGF